MNAVEERVLVLRSNVSTYSDLLQIQHQFDHHPGITRWNIDIDDCDHVIRVVTANLTVADIQKLVTSGGYQCSELD